MQTEKEHEAMLRKLISAHRAACQQIARIAPRLEEYGHCGKCARKRGLGNYCAACDANAR